MKHNRTKNTGILFELLTRQITSDILSGKDSPASKIIKSNFVNTELGKEYKLYESIFKNNFVSEAKANMVINSVLEASKKLNRTSLRKQKYNLIKEIKEYYNLDEFFKTKVSNYKELASMYVLFEIHNDSTYSNPQISINNKTTLLEYLTKPTKEKEKEQNIIKEFQTYDKDLRILTYKILLDKFNTKHSHLNKNQKLVLKEFINSIDSAPKLLRFYNDKINEIKSEIISQTNKTTDIVVKIKLEEISKLLIEINKNQKVKTDNLVDLLQYFELLEELKKING
jgi:hypothetical protein